MRRALPAGLVALAIVSCAGDRDAAPERFGGAPIVLISIDTLRSDRLPAYGYPIGETPAIDALADDAILFERAYSHVPLTLPSHAALLTGVLPDELGVRDNQGYTLPVGAPTLAELLRAEGYATAAAVSSFVLRREAGLVRGFDRYLDPREVHTDVALGALARPGMETLAAIEPWLDEVAERSFFLFFHLFEPHSPHAPPEPFASRHTDPYDGEVAAADAVVGALLARLRARGLYDRAIVLLTSDHGEGLGDHREGEHGIFLYREALQVPLLLKLPRGIRGGERRSEPAQLVDVVPTLLTLSGSRPPDGLPGGNLLHLPAEPRPIFAETAYPRLHYGWSPLRSVIHGDHHLIEAPKPELYDLGIDPGEIRNRLADDRQTAATLRQLLSDRPPFDAPSVDVDPETRRRLAALGYAASTTSTGDAALADPKDRIGDLALLRTAFARARQGQHDLAVLGFREVLERSPAMVEAWQHLGLSLAALEAWDEALVSLGRARALSGDPELRLAAAGVLMRAGRLDEAGQEVDTARAEGATDLAFERRLAVAEAKRGRFADALERLQRLTAGGDEEAATTLGLVSSEAGNQERAIAILEEVLSTRPSNAEALEHLALAHLRRGDAASARSAAQRAVEADPSRPAAWNHLGVGAWLVGDRQAALVAWQRALALAPDDLEVLFNLGTRAAELGEWTLAAPALERYAQLAPPGADRRSVLALLARLEQRS